jgi:hypothetical protein
MRLSEFEDQDRVAHKAAHKENKTVEDRLRDIEKQYISIERIVDAYIPGIHGSKDKIEILLESFNNEVVSFYDFCNECNDDTETRTYLDRLKVIYSAITNMYNKIK